MTPYAAKSLARVPATLREATERLASTLSRARPSAADTVDHYVHFLRTEQRKFDAA